MEKTKIDKMVDRFLCWPIPKDFAPDAGISFKHEPDARGNMPTWPVGTNLLTAEQARQMFEHVTAEMPDEVVLIPAPPPVDNQHVAEGCEQFGA